jgi:hypothetical protein
VNDGTGGISRDSIRGPSVKTRPTTKHMFSRSVQDLSHMLSALILPVTLKALAPGHLLAGAGERVASFSSLTSAEVRDLAEAIVLPLLLLCTLLGYRMVRPDGECRVPVHRLRSSGEPPSSFCESVPARTAVPALFFPASSPPATGGSGCFRTAVRMAADLYRAGTNGRPG